MLVLPPSRAKGPERLLSPAKRCQRSGWQMTTRLLELFRARQMTSCRTALGMDKGLQQACQKVESLCVHAAPQIIV